MNSNSNEKNHIVKFREKIEKASENFETIAKLKKQIDKLTSGGNFIKNYQKDEGKHRGLIVNNGCIFIVLHEKFT